MAYRNLSERWQILYTQIETKCLGVEIYRSADIFDLVSNAPQIHDETLPGGHYITMIPKPIANLEWVERRGLRRQRKS